MKQMKMSILAVGAVIAATVQAAYEWPDSPTSAGVVRLLTNDKNRDQSSIANGAHWSVTDPISDQYDYWVPTGLTIYCPTVASTFAGKSLTLAGNYPDINYRVTFSHLRLMGGAHVHITKSAPIPFEGEITVASTSENPVVFDLDRNDTTARTDVFGAANTLLGAETAQIDFYHNLERISNRPQFGKGDYSGFFGKLRFWRGETSLSQASGNLLVDVTDPWTLPGALELGEGVQLSVAAATAPLTVGELDLQPGSIVQLCASNVTVTGCLAVAQGAKLQFVNYAKPGATDWNKGDFVLMRLTGDAAKAENLPAVENFDLSDNDLGYNYWGAGALAVETDPVDASAKIVVFHSGRPVHVLSVASTYNDYSGKGPELDASWSANRKPLPSEDGFVYSDVCFAPELGNYVFPGGGLIKQGKTVYLGCDSLTISNYFAVPNQTTTLAAYSIGGHVCPSCRGLENCTVIHGDCFCVYGTQHIRMRSARSIVIDAPVCGNGSVFVGPATSGNYPYSQMEFTRVNSGYSGSLTIDSDNPNCTYEKRGYRANVYLTDGRNLGGAMAEDSFDGITLKGDAIIVGRNSLTFDQKNRGIFVVDKFRVVMTNETDNVLTIKTPVTFGGELLFGNDAPTATGSYVGAGHGTLVMGGEARFHDGTAVVGTPTAAAKLTMVVGRLKPTSKEALDGVAITIGAGSDGLELDWNAADPLVCSNGLYNVKSASPLASERPGGKIPVRFVGVPTEAPAAPEVRGICTVRRELAEQVMSKIILARPIAGCTRKLSVVDNDDGVSATIVATVEKTGIVVIIR